MDFGMSGMDSSIQVNIETSYFKTTFDNIFLLMKHEIFMNTKLNLHTSLKLRFQFQDL